MTLRTTLGAGLVVVVLGLAAGIASPSSAPRDGRYKKQGDRCIWDEKDSGPNQCAPLTSGRFKKDGEKCVWEPGDTGGDQCRPEKGRFKQDGSACVWMPDDNGRDQCDPHRSR